MSDLSPLGADEQLIPVQRSWLFCDWVFSLCTQRTKHAGKNEVYAAHCSEERTDLCVGKKNNCSSSAWLNTTSSICFQQSSWLFVWPVLLHNNIHRLNFPAFSLKYVSVNVFTIGQNAFLKIYIDIACKICFFSCFLPSIKGLSNLEIISNSGSVKVHFKTTLGETPIMSVYQHTLTTDFRRTHTKSFNSIKLAPGVSVGVQVCIWNLSYKI